MRSRASCALASAAIARSCSYRSVISGSSGASRSRGSPPDRTASATASLRWGDRRKVGWAVKTACMWGRSHIARNVSKSSSFATVRAESLWTASCGSISWRNRAARAPSDWVSNSSTSPASASMLSSPPSSLREISSESWKTGLKSGVSRVCRWRMRKRSLKLANVGSIVVSAIVLLYAPGRKCVPRQCGGAVKQCPQQGQ